MTKKEVESIAGDMTTFADDVLALAETRYREVARVLEDIVQLDKEPQLWTKGFLTPPVCGVANPDRDDLVGLVASSLPFAMERLKERICEKTGQDPDESHSCIQSGSPLLRLRVEDGEFGGGGMVVRFLGRIDIGVV